MKITLAQINPTVGDLKGNLDHIYAVYDAYKNESDLIVFPELAVCGYPPEDLLLKPSFIDQCEKAVATLSEITKDNDTAVLLGYPWRDPHTAKLYNAAGVFQKGKKIYQVLKHALPNYGVFDEKRYFSSAPAEIEQLFELKGHKIAIQICEDIWQDERANAMQAFAPDLNIVINASPFDTHKANVRHALALEQAGILSCPMIYLNQIGGQDELIFDGKSFTTNSKGKPTLFMKSFKEDIKTIDISSLSVGKAVHPKSEEWQDIYDAQVLGVRDYCRKNGFSEVLIGLSGGIDSALIAVIAVKALGSDHVHTVMMASQFTSQNSVDDARQLAENLQVNYQEISITKLFESFIKALPDQSPIALENIQSRIRGDILMSLSNTSGAMVLTTGNKSEMAVGYATLYGDMCGGYNPLKDLYKTDVFALSHWLNREREIIPTRIITKAPSAELRENQKDQDSLPPYETLDAILRLLIEERADTDMIISQGFDRETVQKVWTMLDRNEYKRRQASPGVKLTPLAFGRDRRYPVTNHFARQKKQS